MPIYLTFQFFVLWKKIRMISVFVFGGVYQLRVGSMKPEILWQCIEIR
jgi:hypothetical protein